MTEKSSNCWPGFEHQYTTYVYQENPLVEIRLYPPVLLDAGFNTSGRGLQHRIQKIIENRPAKTSNLEFSSFLGR